MKKLFAMLVVALFASAVSAGEENTALAQALTAPPPPVSDVRPDSQSGATTPAVSGSVAIPAEPTPALPSRLSGRWNAPGGTKVGQVWSLSNVDLAHKTALLTWWPYSTYGCRLENAQVVVEGNPDAFRILIPNHPCANAKYAMVNFIARVTRHGNEWVAKISADNLEMPLEGKLAAAN